MPAMTAVEFFLRRHQYAVDKFLSQAQNILVLDGGELHRTLYSRSSSS